MQVTTKEQLHNYYTQLDTVRADMEELHRLEKALVQRIETVMRRMPLDDYHVSVARRFFSRVESHCVQQVGCVHYFVETLIPFMWKPDWGYRIFFYSLNYEELEPTEQELESLRALEINWNIRITAGPA
jgi:hypothetical protein